MKEYIKGIHIISRHGDKKKPAREGMAGTKSYSGLQLRFDLKNDRIPIVTTKDVSFKNVVAELLWFLRGNQNIESLVNSGCNIWNDNAYKWFLKINKEEGNPYPHLSKSEFVSIAKDGSDTGLIRSNGEVYRIGNNGRIYGWQWRHRPVDQIEDLVKGMINTPDSRHNKVTAWVKEDMTYDYVSQPNCHGDFMITTRELNGSERLELYKKRVGGSITLTGIEGATKRNGIPTHAFTMNLNQRSGDYALGIPYNITSYALMSYILGIVTNTVPEKLIMTINDAHIYNDHANNLYDQSKLKPKELPKVKINGLYPSEFTDSLFDGDIDKFLDLFNTDDFQLEGYDPHPARKFRLHTGKAKK